MGCALPVQACLPIIGADYRLRVRCYKSIKSLEIEHHSVSVSRVIHTPPPSLHLTVRKFAAHAGLLLQCAHGVRKYYVGHGYANVRSCSLKEVNPLYIRTP